MQFLADTHAIKATVRNGRAAIGDHMLEAANIPDGPAEVFVRPGDLDWSNDGSGIFATVKRIIDRPGSRRLVAVLAGGDLVELDVAPEVQVEPAQAGRLTVLRREFFRHSGDRRAHLRIDNNVSMGGSDNRTDIVSVITRLSARHLVSLETPSVCAHVF